MERIVVHTNWNNTVSETHGFPLDDLLDAGRRDLLKQIFNGSDKLKPQISPQELTAKAAQRFGDIGRRLRVAMVLPARTPAVQEAGLKARAPTLRPGTRLWRVPAGAPAVHIAETFFAKTVT